MAENSYHRGDQEIELQKQTYAGVMKFTGFIGLPFVIALTVFFSTLVTRNGLGMAVVLGVIMYLIVFAVIKFFFR